jgi:peptide/nickel transport system substrate-binding protein
MVAESEYKSWADLFAQRVGVNAVDHGQFVDPDRPRLSAWVLQTPYIPGTQAVAWERNPYYWKVDTQGNQLPYIDRVEFHVVDSTDEIVTRALDGQVDMQNLSWAGVDLAVSSLVQDRDAPVQFYQVEDSANNVMLIQFNLAHPDPDRRALFQNRYFRAGLSHATNRQSIINEVLRSQGQPWQAAPAETSPFFDPAMALQYTEYSLEKANDLLDRAGYRRDVLGSRIGPDGQPISFSILVADSFPQQIAMLNMIATQWAQVGVDVQPKVVALSQFQASVRSNQHDAAAWAGGSSCYYDVLLDPSNYLPFGDDTLWAVNWSKGYRKAPGFESEQPAAPVRLGMDMYDRIRPSASTIEQQRLMKGALLVAREGFWTIGIARVPQRFGIQLESFHNVPDPMPSGWLYPDPGPANPEQFFIAQ